MLRDKKVVGVFVRFSCAASAITVDNLVSTMKNINAIRNLRERMKYFMLQDF
jgi:hypothetical protein